MNDQGPFSAEYIRKQEKEVICTARRNLDDSCDDSHPPNLFGLALSGGGIRSATFNLGLLQAMAERKLLQKLDYLSTVSGGGYIGGWFSALLHRHKGTFGELEDNIRAADANGKLKDEPTEIQRLRKCSNYLTPNPSPFSLDWLTAVVILSRNLILNQLLLVFMIVTALLVPLGLTFFFEGKPSTDWYVLPLCLLVGLLLTLASTQIARSLSVANDDQATKYDGWWVLWWIVMPSFAAALLMAWGILHMPEAYHTNHAIDWVCSGMAVYSTILIAGDFFSDVRHWIDGKKNQSSNKSCEAACIDLVVRIFGALGAGAVTGLLLYGYAHLPWLDDTHKNMQSDWLSLGLGTSLIFGILCLGLAAHIGLAKRHLSEFAREWLGRMGGQAIAIQLAWACLCLAAFYGPALFRYMNQYVELSGGVAWLATTVAGFWLARSDKTGGKDSSRWAELAAHVAPYVFIVGLVVLVSAGLHLGLSKYADVHATPEPENVVLSGQMNVTTPEGSQHWYLESRAPETPQFWKYAEKIYCEHMQIRTRVSIGWLLVLFGLLVWFLSWRIDINLFSMQQFYRNRLTRCYLGAVNQDRNPDRFTGFAKDDLVLSHLGNQRPVHLINTALNLTRIGDDDSQNSAEGRLEWQQRMSASFIFSPLFCGFSFPGQTKGGYRNTSAYMSREGQWSDANGGPQLGMAMAISGAAANPNMGYHTSLATSFLMTFFNIRLGRWCGNPWHKESFQSSSPALGHKYLLMELFGSTDATTKYVNLSDGGHFENLGLYELVRRKCRLIMVSDASCDPDFQFEDLANAIVKCRVDLGAEISIDVSLMREADANQKSADPENRHRWVVGKIAYDDGNKGLLVYIKPLLRKNGTPVDILNYADTHPGFPHESTADQWFDESQFESYRQLGLLTGHEIFQDASFTKHKELRCIDQWVEKMYQELKQVMAVHLNEPCEKSLEEQKLK